MLESQTADVLQQSDTRGLLVCQSNVCFLSEEISKRRKTGGRSPALSNSTTGADGSNAPQSLVKGRVHDDMSTLPVVQRTGVGQVLQGGEKDSDTV